MTADSHKTVRQIAEAVCSVMEGEPGRILSTTRGSARDAWRRHVTMYIYHSQVPPNWSAIGREFGRDRSTVRDAVRRVQDAHDESVLVERQINKIFRTLYG